MLFIHLSAFFSNTIFPAPKCAEALRLWRCKKIFVKRMIWHFFNAIHSMEFQGTPWLRALLFYTSFCSENKVVVYIRVGYKEWVIPVERLSDSCQWGPLTQPFYGVDSLLKTHSNGGLNFPENNEFLLTSALASKKLSNKNNKF